MKNIYKKIILIFIIFLGVFSVNIAYGKELYKNDYINISVSDGSSLGGSDGPEIGCKGLPGCGKSNPSSFLVKLVDLFIQIVAVLSVFALIFSGIMYMLSAGEEDKANKAKKWIIWSLIGVFLSATSWGIIYFLNNINFK